MKKVLKIVENARDAQPCADCIFWHQCRRGKVDCLSNQQAATLKTVYNLN